MIMGLDRHLRFPFLYEITNYKYNIVFLKRSGDSSYNNSLVHPSDGDWAHLRKEQKGVLPRDRRELDQKANWLSLVGDLPTF